MQARAARHVPAVWPASLVELSVVRPEPVQVLVRAGAPQGVLDCTEAEVPQAGQALCERVVWQEFLVDEPDARRTQIGGRASGLTTWSRTKKPGRRGPMRLPG